MTRIATIAALAAASAGFAAPAAAADIWVQETARERSAFAGASVRLQLGGRQSAAPEARLGVGFYHSRHDPAGGMIGSTVPALPLAVGFGGGRPELLAGGERLSEIERRLGLSKSSTTLLLLGGIAAGVAAVVLLADGNDDEEDGPCPPGVEVCTQ